MEQPEVIFTPEPHNVLPGTRQVLVYLVQRRIELQLSISALPTLHFSYV